MHKSRLFSNALSSVLQVLVTSGTLFVLYKVLLKTIGVKQLGVWSLVMATGSLTQIANLGLVGSMTKFVAKYAAREEHGIASRVIQTAVTSLALSTGVALAIIYLCIKPALPFIIPSDSVQLALSILPYAFVSVWIMILAGVFQAGLDGYQRIDSRNIVVMIGSLIYLGLCTVFALTWGLVGMAIAGVFQSLWLLLVTWYVLRKRLPSLPVWRYRWDRRLFKEMLGYGVKFQLMSISIMLTDPVTKVFLGKFGGLVAVGYYEMCNRMVQQLRALIVSPGFTLVPAAADLKERAAERIKNLYSNSYNLTFCIAAAAFSLVIMYAPVISQLWIGHYEQTFVTFAFLLCLGWFFNILAVPAYFINLGTGDLRWNVVGHVSTAVINAIAGLALGREFGALGVVVAWVVSLTACSLFISVSYHVKYRIPLSQLMPRSSIILIGVCIFGIAFTYLVLPQFLKSVYRLSVYFVNYTLLSLSILALLWVHPSRKYLSGLIIRRAG